MNEKKTARDNETVRHTETDSVSMSHNVSMPQRYRKSTQRTQAMGNDYFLDCQTFDSLIQSLETRGTKTRRQWKIDCRLAHSIKSRQKQKVRQSYLYNGSVRGLELAKNARLENKNFYVCQTKQNALNYSSIYRNIGGTVETEFTERFKKERADLKAELEKLYIEKEKLLQPTKK